MSKLAPILSLIRETISLGKVTSAVVLLFLVAHIKSWPLAYHIRVFRPFVTLFLRKRLTFTSERQNLDNVATVGIHPFEFSTTRKTTATVDDCDWNMHLSNSSYAKNLDYARMKALSTIWFPFWFDGGYMALGGTTFRYLSEIPMRSEYGIVMKIAGWDEKWMYIVGQFISYPSKRTKPGKPSTVPMVEPLADASTTSLAPTTWSAFDIPPGATLHCISISQHCFKHGRMTVPPEVAFATLGLGPDGRTKWNRFQEMRFSDKGIKGGEVSYGNPNQTVRDFYRNAEWKQPRQEREWWRVDETIAQNNAERMKSLRRLREGLSHLGSDKV